MIPACARPITAAGVPCRRSASVTVKITPVNAKLTSGAWIMTARSSECRRTRRTPAPASLTRLARSACRSGVNRPLMRLTVPQDTR